MMIIIIVKRRMSFNGSLMVKYGFFVNIKINCMYWKVVVILFFDDRERFSLNFFYIKNMIIVYFI